MSLTPESQSLTQPERHPMKGTPDRQSAVVALKWRVAKIRRHADAMESFVAQIEKHPDDKELHDAVWRMVVDDGWGLPPPP
jgi:hypothetical protein